MNEFVQACRKEWKRLRVPDFAAEEMASELEVHLAEADADGLTTVQALGPIAADPPSFARIWAEARGVVPSTAPAVDARTSQHSRRRLPIAFIASGLAALAGAVIETQRPTWRHFLGYPHLRFLGTVTGRGSYWAGPPVEVLKTGTLLLVVGIVGLIASGAYRVWTRRQAQSSMRLFAELP